jgi:DNA-binding transcriptional LysR family regulator
VAHLTDNAQRHPHSHWRAASELGRLPCSTRYKPNWRARASFREVFVTADENTVGSFMWPKLSKVLPNYPGIQVEIVTNYGLIGIVAVRHNVDVWLSGVIAKDMIAAPIDPEMGIAVVASPSYLAAHGGPEAPGPQQ